MSNVNIRYDKEILARKYAEICPRYKRLAFNLHQALDNFLHAANIDVLDISYRIKKFDSFWDKIQRKQYKEPLEEIEDICGLRIICYYPSDLEKVSQIINEEFDVLEKTDKADLLEPDKFGYRSLHFIVTVKKDWLKAPNYRGLGDLKAEIQLRTILMHAWDEIEHKLAYKKKEHIPEQFKRKLYRLSALFEVADEQFDSLRNERKEYIDSLVSEEIKKRGRFDVNQEMNLDSLQAFLEFYFPNREKHLLLTTELLDEIINFNVTMKDLVESYERTKEILTQMEAEEIEQSKHVGEHIWAQVGVVRTILDLTNDNYWQSRRVPDQLPDDVIEVTEKWRAKLSSRK